MDIDGKNGPDEVSSDRPPESKEAVVHDWVEAYLSSLPVPPSGFQLSSVIMIATRIEGTGDGQLSREEIIKEITDLSVDGFIDKYTEDRRFFSKKTGTSIRRPDPEVLRRAEQMRADGASGSARGFPRRSFSSSSMPAVNPQAPAATSIPQDKPGTLLAGVRRTLAGVSDALSIGRRATGRRAAVSEDVFPDGEADENNSGEK